MRQSIARPPARNPGDSLNVAMAKRQTYTMERKLPIGIGKPKGPIVGSIPTSHNKYFERRETYRMGHG
jgi:hypothetical protein